MKKRAKPTTTLDYILKAADNRIKMCAPKYPRLSQLKIKIHKIYGGGFYPYVKWADIDKALTKAQRKKFSDYFGVQTTSEHGPYPHDVEAVLERIFSGKNTGTQLYWD